MLGLDTSAVEISLVSNKGFWLLLDDEEHFLSYADFPWFQNARVSEVMTIERLSATHLYWPLLDVDLSLHTIKAPAAFPLIARSAN
jgi:Protein of unknown function (DUF2442)